MMLTQLKTRYPDHDWDAMEILPIIYMSGTDEYRVNESLWPSNTYPNLPSSDDIKGWLG